MSLDFGSSVDSPMPNLVLGNGCFLGLKQLGVDLPKVGLQRDAAKSPGPSRSVAFLKAPRCLFFSDVVSYFPNPPNRESANCAPGILGNLSGARLNSPDPWRYGRMLARRRAPWRSAGRLSHSEGSRIPPFLIGRRGGATGSENIRKIWGESAKIRWAPGRVGQISALRSDRRFPAVFLLSGVASRSPPPPFGRRDRGFAGAKNTRKFGENPPKQAGFQGGVAEF